MSESERYYCTWPVTDERPSALNPPAYQGHDCPEPRCEKPAGHEDHHGGWFDQEELEKVETIH